MRTIFRIFKNDVKGLWRNKLALLIALAICVLPSLYAWFNIYSNWDPYSIQERFRLRLFPWMRDIPRVTANLLSWVTRS